MAFKINNTDISTLFANGNIINPDLTFLLSDYGFNNGTKYVIAGRTSTNQFPAWCNTSVTDSNLLNKYKYRKRNIPFVNSKDAYIPILNSNYSFGFQPVSTTKPIRSGKVIIQYNLEKKELYIYDQENNNDKTTITNYNIDFGIFFIAQAPGGGGGGASNGFVQNKRRGGGGGGGGAFALFFINLYNFANSNYTFFINTGKGGVSGGNPSGYPATGNAGSKGETTYIYSGSPNSDLTLLAHIPGGYGGDGGNHAQGDNSHSPGGYGGTVAVIASDSLKNKINILFTARGNSGGRSGKVNYSTNKNPFEGIGNETLYGNFKTGITTETFPLYRMADQVSQNFYGIGGSATTPSDTSKIGISGGGGGGASLFSTDGFGYGTGGSGGWGATGGVGGATDGQDGCVVVLTPLKI